MISQVVKLADVIADKAVLADLIAPGLHIVGFAELLQLPLAHFKKAAHLVNGTEFRDGLVGDVGDFLDILLPPDKGNWEPQALVFASHRILRFLILLLGKIIHKSLFLRNKSLETTQYIQYFVKLYFL